MAQPRITLRVLAIPTLTLCVFVGGCAQAEEKKAGSSSAAAPPTLIAPFDAHAAQASQTAWAKHLGKQVIEKNSIGMEFVLIPPGLFKMGAPKSEIDTLLGKGHRNREELETQTPQVEVTLTKPFYVGKTEVTQAQYKSVTGKNPSWCAKTGAGKSFVKGLITDDFPVEFVSWDEAQAFCRKLSQKEGAKYRLLTEAEWEYACRAGTITQFSTGNSLDSSKANINAKLGRTTSVGTYSPNAFGLYDMHGNVFEWCEDVYTAKLPGKADPLVTEGGTERVYRGGGFSDFANDARSANRAGDSPNGKAIFLGFRVARSN